ncbi:cytochrome c oxidase assembly protein [Marinobacter sp. C2H3]|uniref:cytochrome c oxidase assembly protein n=1 Tax=Marinobacter sp. C2H3 TaxID=3119003 RepID=UPI00300EA2BB
MPDLAWILPYDPSPLALVAFALTAAGYAWAAANLPPGAGPGWLRQLTFWLGLALCYAVMQTRFDYYAQYMFFVHRGQHLVLHHLGPFLMVLSNPLPVLRYWHGRLPAGLRRRARPLILAYRVLQHPVVAPVLFVGLIYLWLWPPVHFVAMLSRPLYWLMNTSMLVDGLLFWWLVLDPRSPWSATGQRVAGVLGYGRRILILALVAIPQMALGAWIVFSQGTVYDVYEVCGRAWPMAPATDQLLGGLLTWIPPAMMSVLGILLLVRRALHDDARRHAPYLTEAPLP